MPFLRFAGVEKVHLQDMACTIMKEVSRIVNVSEEKVKIELLQVEQITNTPPSLEISMFPRETYIHDSLAARLYTLLKEYGYANIHIFFVLLTPSLYYKEGQSLGKANLPVKY